MLLKIVIIVLLVGVVLSLFSSLTFLFRDVEHPGSKRALYALGVRVVLATMLLLTVFYGFYSGQLRIGANAPWHQLTTSKHVNEQKQAYPHHVDEMPVP